MGKSHLAGASDLLRGPLFKCTYCDILGRAHTHAKLDGAASDRPRCIGRVLRAKQFNIRRLLTSSKSRGIDKLRHHRDLTYGVARQTI
jgi:hypothetical protein